jgi:hypothetical protein
MLILDRINFDTGQINPGGGEDLGFVIDGERPLLVPQGSALQAVRGGSTPSYADCVGSAYVNSPIRLRQQNPGTYICYRTDQGLFGWVRLISLNEDTGELSIQYQTWANP